MQDEAQNAPDRHAGEAGAEGRPDDDLRRGDQRAGRGDRAHADQMEQGADDHRPGQGGSRDLQSLGAEKPGDAAGCQDRGLVQRYIAEVDNRAAPGCPWSYIPRAMKPNGTISTVISTREAWTRATVR